MLQYPMNSDFCTVLPMTGTDEQCSLQRTLFPTVAPLIKHCFPLATRGDVTCAYDVDA
jgi:hypothetical protein